MATRFEKIIKKMTVEEVADWWVGNIHCPICPIVCDNSKKCEENVINYLNEEVSEEPEVCASCAIDFGEGEEL